MSTLQELQQRLLKPLELEQKRGCQNDAVVGGIEKLVLTLGRPFTELHAIIAGYEVLDVASRQQAIERAIAHLQSQIAARPVQLAQSSAATPKTTTPSNRHTQAAASVSRKPRLGEDGLDHLIDRDVLDLGAQASQKLAGIGVKQYRHLLYHFPRQYEDRRKSHAFASLDEQQENVTVAGQVTGRKGNRSAKGLHILRVFLEDSYGGRLQGVWFNQPWLEKQLYPGQKLVVSGKLKRKGRQLELHVQEHEIDDDKESLSMGRIVPIYPSTQGLSQAYVRRSVFRLLENLAPLSDFLSPEVRQQEQLISQDQAMRAVHFPRDPVQLQQAIRRIKFDEFLLLELRILLNRDLNTLGIQHRVHQRYLEGFLRELPFDLTQAQQRVLEEILSDMKSPKQMARLLQGDVGSGKTAVAAASMYVSIKNGYQSLLMAPTEILARQHFSNLREYLFPLGVQIDLLIGSMTRREARFVKDRLEQGDIDLVVGTHALIQEDVKLGRPGLVVIDEEHRFGVEQRRSLLESKPDVLVMSATPIPRSLALTLYGDLELSIIDELPPGRQGINTKLVNDSKRRDVYRFAWGQIQAGRQVYVVTPLIEESEAETMASIVSAQEHFASLKALMPESCRIELLHGKMTAQEKDDVMGRFRNKAFDLLVSTTVIEVGVDVANASVMIIENAERFGLSQLHQLRGRVGRGEYQSYCILVAGDRSKKTQRRLEIIERHHDGFIIAEKDLELRGPGEIRGTKQSGIPDLVLGDLSQDGDIIERARELAKAILNSDPKLEATEHQGLRQELKRQLDAVSYRQII